MPDIGVKLTGDNTEFRGMLADSTEQGEGFAGKLAGKIGDKLYGLRDVSHTVATALGINLENIAEKLAERITGLDDLQRKAYEHSNELQNQAFELQKKNNEALLTDEQKYQAAILLRDKLQKELEFSIITSGKTQDAVAAKHIEQEKAIADIIAYEKKQQEEATKENEKAVESYLKGRAAISEKERAAYLDQLDAAGKVDALKKDIAVQEAVIRNITATTEQTEQRKNKLAETRIELGKAELKAADDIAKTNRDIEDSYEKQAAENQKLIAQTRDRILAEQGVLNEFEKQLAAIQQLAGAGQQGFKVGSDGTVSIGQLQQAADEAKKALAYAQSSNQINSPNGIRQIVEAQALVDQSQRNLDRANFSVITASNSTRVNANLLDFSSVAAAADAALGTRASVATAQATALIGRHGAATVGLLADIRSGLIAGGVITGSDTATITGSGGAPSGDLGTGDLGPLL